MQATALMAGLCSALGVALSTSLQHQAAGRAPRQVGSAGLLLHLVRRPRWLAGQALSLSSFGMHAVALQSGALAVVQPVVVSGMVLAVPVRAALSRRRPSMNELGAVVLTAVGLATFLVASRPTVGTAWPGTDRVALAVTGVGLALAVLIHRLATRCLTGPRRAAMLGVVAGILFGLLAGLLKLSVLHLQAGGLGGLLTGWWPWAVVLTGVAGAAVNQEAYRAGSLSASMPVLNIVDVLVGLAAGLVIFGEVPAHSPSAVAAEGVALGCVALGLRGLTAPEEPRRRAFRSGSPPGHRDDDQS